MSRQRTLNDNIYYFAAVLITVNVIFRFSSYDNNFFAILSSVAYILFCVKFCLTKYTSKELLLFVGLCIIGFICAYITQSIVMLMNVVLIFSAKNVNRQSLFNIVLITMTICTVGIAFYTLANGYNTIHSAGGHMLGFNNPNLVQYFITMASVYYIAVNIKNIQQWKLAIISGLNIMMCIITDCKTQLITILVVWVLGGILKSSLGKKIFLFKFERAFFALVILNVFLVIFYRRFAFTKAIDYFLSWRLNQANYYYNRYGISLLGNYIAELELDVASQRYRAILDSGYLKALINYGAVFFLIMIVMIFLSLKQARLKRDYCCLILFCAISFQLIGENMGLLCSYNFSLVYFSDIIFDRKNIAYSSNHLGSSRIRFRKANSIL